MQKHEKITGEKYFNYGSPFEKRILLYIPRIYIDEANMVFSANNFVLINEFIKENCIDKFCIYTKGRVIFKNF